MLWHEKFGGEPVRFFFHVSSGDRTMQGKMTQLVCESQAIPIRKKSTIDQDDRMIHDPL
jgi:hypothetical protein